MDENKLNQPGELINSDKPINVDLIVSTESIKNVVRRDGYILLNCADMQADGDIDIDDVSAELEKEGFKRDGNSKDDIIYDPNRFEIKKVDVYKGLDKKYINEGWKDVSYSGNHAILIKEK